MPQEINIGALTASSSYQAAVLNGTARAESSIQTMPQASYEAAGYSYITTIENNAEIIPSNSNSISFVSIFESQGTSVNYPSYGDTADGRTNDLFWYTPDFPADVQLISNYSDIINQLRVVDDNIKVCPNNMDKGTWKKDYGKYYWESNEPVYIIIISKEGYLLDRIFSSYNVSSDWCVGTFDAVPNQELVLDGLLVYPYGPAILSDPNAADSDGYGGNYPDKYDSVPFYNKRGKILGSSSERTLGIISIESEL